MELHGRGKGTQEVLHGTDRVDVNTLPGLISSSLSVWRELVGGEWNLEEPVSCGPRGPCARPEGFLTASTSEKASRKPFRFTDLWVTLQSCDWLQNLFLKDRRVKVLGNDKYNFFNVIQDNTYLSNRIHKNSNHWIRTLCGHCAWRFCSYPGR